MGYTDCLNILERPEVFIPTAALIVIVLLVWAQLSVPRERRDLDKDFNLVCGFAWTYLAIFFALSAVAAFIYDKTTQCPKGLLALSFLMTAINMLIAFGLIIIKLGLNIPVSESVTKVESGRARICWTAFWLFLLAGLVLISFSLVGSLCRCCLWIGVAAAFCGVSIVFWHYRRRLNTYIKWYSWEKWRVTKRNKGEND